MTGGPDRTVVVDTVKRLVIQVSRLRIPVDRVADDEPLNGALLSVTSFGFVGMLLQIEDELAVTLPEDLFVGRSFDTVADLVDTVLAATS